MVYFYAGPAALYERAPPMYIPPLRDSHGWHKGVRSYIRVHGRPSFKEPLGVDSLAEHGDEPRIADVVSDPGTVGEPATMMSSDTDTDCTASRAT